MEDVFKTTDKANRFDANGHEVLNPTPMAPPLGYKKTPSLAEQIRQQVLTMRAIDMEPETEEEADDFDIEDDPAPQSRWENDMIPSIKETRARLRALENQAQLYAVPKPPPADPTPLVQPPPDPEPPPTLPAAGEGRAGGFFRPRR